LEINPIIPFEFRLIDFGANQKKLIPDFQSKPAFGKTKNAFAQ